MKRTILSFLLFLFVSASIHAFYLKSYQVEDGLSHNSVWAVMQDRKGFLWFGTNEGLNRFDGKHFKVYKKQQGDSLSIGDNFIHCLKEDSQGRFFIGTKSGLYLFNHNTEKFRHIDISKSAGDKEVSINAILEDPDGNIWLACHGQGVYVLNPDLSIKKHYIKDNKPNGLPVNFVWTIAYDYTGNVWLGTDGEGLLKLDTKNDTFIKMSDNDEWNLKDPVIYSLYCDIDNNIWIGTSVSGLYKYNSRTGKVSNYLNRQANSIKSIIEYSDQELIMGSDKGLVRFNRISDVYTFLNNERSFDNITDFSIFSITKDREGSFWIGTYFGGVNYFSPTINYFSYFYDAQDNSSRKNIISNFTEDENGKIWVGTHTNGLYLFDPRTSSYEHSPFNIGYHDVQDLLFDNDNLYISLYGKGVNILNTKSGKITELSKSSSNSTLLSDNAITTIFKTSKGRIIFGAEDGASYIDQPSTALKKIVELANIPIKDIVEDYNGTLWFATHAHGIKKLSVDGKWSSIVHDPKNANSLISNNINCIYLDYRYKIWIGTEGDGLVMYNPRDDKFEWIINEESGLPSNIIYSILDDSDGNIWVTTGGGLVKINSDDRTVKSFRYIGEKENIRYNLNCAFRTSDNKLYFGGTNGFIAFNPKEIVTNSYIPPILITGFQISSKEMLPGASYSPLSVSITETKEIVLDHDQSNFSFDFVALSFLAPSQNQYAYMLEGFDETWHYTTDNKAIYMNIPPGEYVFKVKGSNNDGVWNDKETTIKINIKPSFWMTVPMILLYIIFILGVLTYIILWYRKRVETKQQSKIFKYKVLKDKEMYESKINFFTNIAHEIRTPLSLIKAPLENIIVSGDGNQQTKNNLEIIDNNANRLLELINQLLDFRKIEEDMFHFNFKMCNINDIVQDVYNQYLYNAKLHNLEMSLNIQNEETNAWMDSEAIYKIVSNLISNAIKYAKHQIEVSVISSYGNLQITVKDDGVGISKEDVKRIFEPFYQAQSNENILNAGSGLGLSLSQSLAEKHDGKITVQSELNMGSMFILTMPIKKQEINDLQESEALVNIESSQVLQKLDKVLKILVVEDNSELRAFLENSLSEDHVVFVAENGFKALELIEKESIDVIISDILMPEMDGLELTQKLKSDPAYSHIPIILLSAKTDVTSKVEGLNVGADVYLEKPFSIKQLKAQITSIIDNRNRMRESFIKSPLQYFKQNKENDENAEFVEKLNEAIVANISDEKFSIDNLSEQFFMSRSNFYKKIKAMMGITPNDYIKLIRLNKSAQLLSTGKYKINEVCFMVGFNTPSYFSKCFYEQFGKLPKDFINNE